MLDGVDWGNVPAWTGSLLTSGSLLFAALAYRRSVRDKEREQASQISAWTSNESTGERRLWLSNHSDLTIYSLTIQPFQAEVITYAKLDAKESLNLVLPGYDRSVLGRKTEVRFGNNLVATKLTLDSVGDEPLPELTFRDAAGRWWRRDGRGKLSNTRPQEPVRPSLGLYLFGANIATLSYNATTGEWEIGTFWKRTRRAAHEPEEQQPG